MSKALNDVVVLDLTTEFWSGLGAALLGDFGARVVRVEKLPEARERRQDGMDPDPDAPWDYRVELAQRNKSSLAVDLDRDEGREILAGLVRRADVFVTDWSVARLEQYGCDYTALSSLKPDLIYARGSGFGPKGPDRDLPPLDELAAARTGVMPTLPQPGQPPVYPESGLMYTTVMLAFGVLAALRHRHETGEGQEVDVSLLAGNMYGASLDLQAFLAIGGDRFLRPLSRTDAGNPMSGTLYQSKDGRWVTLTMPDTDRWWPGLSEIVGLDIDDPRFDTHDKRCEENRLELIRVLEKAFEQKPGAHWRGLFAEKQLSADVIEDYTYPTDDPQAAQNRYILELDHPSLGPMKTLGFPIFLNDSPPRLHATAPGLGQHSAEILFDLLEYPEDRIEALEASGVVA
jgi:formyl-CoA transferase